MSPNHEYQLEKEIDRELKALPEIPAPATLILRIMQAIARRQALPWFKRAWQTWPGSLRVVSFGLLVLLFGGLCFGIWEISTVGSAVATQKYGSMFSLVGTLWNTVITLGTALAHAVVQLPKGVLIGCLAAVGLGYAMCVALGTFCFALVRNVHHFNNEK
jgi:hypothetical protein